MSLIGKLRGLTAAENLSTVAVQSFDLFSAGAIGPDLTQIAVLEAEIRAIIGAADDGELISAYRAGANDEQGQQDEITAELKRRGINLPSS